MRPKVYLAGPIAGNTYDQAEGWRAYAREVLEDHGIEVLSPLRAKDFLASEGLLHQHSYDVHPLSTNKGITTRDRFDCQRADVVLVNLLGAERVTIGTMIELGWADAARRPIVLALEEGGVHDHAIVREVAGFIVPSLDEAIQLTIAILAAG